MPVTISCRLRFGRYDAATERRRDAEWPPHPARLFCALVASARVAADDTALRWLENQAAPEVWAARDVAESRASSYVVTNATEARSGSQTWPGRTNGVRFRASALPASDTFAVVWPDADADDATLGRLLRLAMSVPYLGRSTSPAEVNVLPAVPEPRADWSRWVPAQLGAMSGVDLRVPYPGYLAVLRDAYEAGRPPWETARLRTYVSADDPPSPDGLSTDGDVVASPYSDLLVWGIGKPSVPLAGEGLLAVTDVLRRAVISLVPEPVPPQVSGHGADGATHVAFLPLPHVDHEHADGHLLGFGVAVPRDLPAEHRGALLRGLLGPDRLRQLRLPRGRRLDLEYRPERRRPYGLRAERWTRAGRGARTWVTVTPLMVDRFPKKSRGLADVVADSLVTAGYPRPVAVQTAQASPIRGAVHRLSRGTLPPDRHRRPLVHAQVRFPDRVVGPVIAGSLRYLGLGLFIASEPEEAG